MPAGRKRSPDRTDRHPVGTCVRCERSNLVIRARGLCSTCYSGSEEGKCFPLVMEWSPWTVREERWALALRAEKLSYPEIAKKMGRSLHSVRGWFRYRRNKHADRT